MKRWRKNNLSASVLLCVLIGPLVFSCRGKDPEEPTGPSYRYYDSYLDIPGISRGEIDAIERLKKERSSFSFGMTFSNEAFSLDEKEGGYSALFCRWLSDLFGIYFELKIFEWDELLEALENRNVDFSGEIGPPESQRGIYLMTSEIAPRALKVFRVRGRPIMREVPRYAILEGTIFDEMTAPYLDSRAEWVYVKNDAETYELLQSGAIDAYIDDETAEAAYSRYDDIEVTAFSPRIQSPVSLVTVNPALAPVISVVQKYLEQGADLHLAELRRQGKEDYFRWKMQNLLTESEKEFIRRHNNPGNAVKTALDRYNYPVSFYHDQEENWQGIVPEFFSEIGKLTGLHFQTVTAEKNEDLELMLEQGEVSLIAAPIPFRKQEGLVWMPVPDFTDVYALLSRLDYPDVDEIDVAADKVGLVIPSLAAEVFYEWFPQYQNPRHYESINDAFDGLDKGEINLVMSLRNRRVLLLNHYGRTDYKVNYYFDQTSESGFGFRLEEAELASIIGKARSLIDTGRMMNYWTRRFFDYRHRLAQEQRPYLIGIGVLVALVIALLTQQLLRNRMVRKRLEKMVLVRTGELEKQTKLAQSANVVKSKFLASMSHEIRTPMNAIIGMSDLMRTDNLDEQQTNYFSDIKRMAKSLLQIINDILDISKIEAGKMDIVPVHFSITALYDNIVSLGSFSAKAKDLEFRHSCGINIPPVLYADEGRVRQVITNLLSNAVKYTKQGHVEFRMERQNREGNGWIVFSVADTGIGIKRENFLKLFGDFEQFDKEKNYGIAGTGLGLAITKNLVKMMGGDIDYDSEYGKGSVFTIYLPLVEGDPSKVKQIGAAGKVIAGDGVKVLVVDDNSINLNVAQGFLSSHHIKADTATSGRGAIEMLEERRYDLVFMDHMMPEMDGVETARLIRTLSDPWLKEMPIVALSANAMAGAREEFIAAGMNDFIAKPIMAEELNAMLIRWLPADKIHTAGESPRAEHTKEPLKKEYKMEQDVENDEPEEILLAELAKIEGLDTTLGLSHVADVTEVYFDILRQFCTEFEGYMTDIQKNLAAEDWKNYAVRLHAMKGVLATIGMDSISKWAYKLELAGKAEDAALCKSETEGICSAMRAFKEQLEETSLMMEEDAGPKIPVDAETLKEKLAALKAACAGGDSDTADPLAEEISRMTLDEETDKVLEEISALTTGYDYEAAIEKIEGLLGLLG